MTHSTPRRSLSTRERVRLFELHNGDCHICKGKIFAGQVWDVEHVIPLCWGGADDDANRKPAHRRCHKEKTPEDVHLLAKAKRRRAKHIGIKPHTSRPIPGSRASGLRKKFNGQVERRT